VEGKREKGEGGGNIRKNNRRANILKVHYIQCMEMSG
jgi:hypothetical protein